MAKGTNSAPFEGYSAARPDPHSSPGIAPIAARLEAEGVENLTVFQAAARIASVNDRPSVVVLYSTDMAWRREDFDGLVMLAEFCAGHGLELLAFNTDLDDALVAELPAFLASKKARFPATHIYRWRSGLLNSSFTQLGIEEGQTWTPPLVAVRDRTGTVVAQAQSVRDWAGVVSAARATLD